MSEFDDENRMHRWSPRKTWVQWIVESLLTFCYRTLLFIESCRQALQTTSHELGQRTFAWRQDT